MAVIGYYTLGAGGGLAPQLGVIQDTGHTPLDMDNLTSFDELSVAFVNNPSSVGHTNDYKGPAATQAIEDWVTLAGGVFVFHDRSAHMDHFNFANSPPGAHEIDFVNDGGPISNGSFATLTDASLDGLASSNHGFVDIDLVQDLEWAFLLTRSDAGQGVTVLESEGRGYRIESAIPLDYWIDPAGGFDGDMLGYATNLMLFAADLAVMSEAFDGDDFTDDVIVGSVGANDIFGRDGDDAIDSGRGADFVHGGLGSDTLLSGRDDDFAWGGRGKDTLRGGGGEDQLWGGLASDRLYGQEGDDFMVGGGGADRLDGGDGDDVLFGNDQADKLVGRAGANRFIGGDATDTMKAGSGLDVFVFDPGDADDFSGPLIDTIQGFAVSTDKIDVSGFHLSFTFVLGPHTGVANEISIVNPGLGPATVSIDLDGDSVGEEQFLVFKQDVFDTLYFTDFIT